MCNIRGVQLVGTVTVGASGGAANTGSIYPALANTPFKNLSITIKPLENDFMYTVNVYFHGELEETHNFPTNDRTICFMNFPQSFPANIGEVTIPKYATNLKLEARGLPVLVELINHSFVEQTFQVFAVFEAFDPPQFGKVTEV